MSSLYRAMVSAAVAASACWMSAAGDVNAKAAASNAELFMWRERLRVDNGVAIVATCVIYLLLNGAGGQVKSFSDDGMPADVEFACKEQGNVVE